jgi:biopolymer transport protein ExbB
MEFLTLAQASPPAGSMGLWDLFRQSFDLFSVVLMIGSLASVAIIFSCLLEVRERNILPKASVDRINDLVAGGRWDDLRSFLDLDDSFVGRVIRIAFKSSGKGRDSMREATELAAAEESARWFRRIELLNLIGNLGPLVGLGGQPCGAWCSPSPPLGATGGQAGPSDLSLGISKALFHTLLGLLPGHPLPARLRPLPLPHRPTLHPRHGHLLPDRSNASPSRRGRESKA